MIVARPYPVFEDRNAVISLASKRPDRVLGGRFVPMPMNLTHRLGLIFEFACLPA